jgi:hypothetical protein
LKFIRKTSAKDEEEFLKGIFPENRKPSKLDVHDEHQILNEILSKTFAEHRHNLLFFHWYERRYQRNVITKDVLRRLNDSIAVRLESIHDEVREEFISHMDSKTHNSFTIYHEYYTEFFPNIERFDFNEFRGREFAEYLLGLFPELVEIDFMSRKRFFRFENKELLKLDYDYNNLVLYYKKFRLPSFYPFRLEEAHTYTPLSLMSVDKREIENEVRSEKGIPLIGQGWISETMLFQQIQSTFTELKVVQHASPHWLGRQHLDVFIPEKLIAIEYQGLQHSQPVEFFGGQDAFEKTLERDERKRLLCEENNVNLLYVYPDTDTERFILQLKDVLLSKDS